MTSELTRPVTTSVVTVPSLVLVLAPLDPDVRAAIAGECGVLLGDCIEVDVQAADRVSPGSAQVLLGYWETARALWDALAAGSVPPGALVVTRELVAVRQVDTKDARRDLAPEMKAIADSDVLAPALAILDAEPDTHLLSQVGRVVRSDERAQVTVEVRGRHFPPLLGGARSRSEACRRVTLEASHAAWRDRRVRRFTRLAVNSDEVWPTPKRS